MKNKFTSISYLVLCVLMCSFSTMDAQLSFQINSPANVAGTYDFALASFGGEFPSQCNPDAVTAEFVIADDGDGVTSDACQALTNDLTGKIALIDRGACEFGVKCLNAQNAGAIAIVVCNNTGGLLSMSGGAVGDQVTIPALMIGMDDCNLIRMEIPTVEASITFTPQPIPTPSTVFWGDQPGQGDFDGGLNGWTTTHDAACDTVDLWAWSPNGTSNGEFGGGTSQALTACNGAMTFDSDFFDTNGGTGTPLCPAPHTAELISPMINLADATANIPGIVGVSVSFYQATRQFGSTYIVSYSNDGGSNWNDRVINNQIPVNSNHINERIRIFLPGADWNSTEFQFKFRYVGNYYYWIIDDVQLVASEGNNMRANTFFSIAPNRLTPKTQTDSLHFIVDIENLGALDQTNVNTNITITNSGGNTVHNQDLAYGTVPASFLDENKFFSNTYTPPAVADTYEAVYTVSSDSVDFDLSDNTQRFEFAVTDSVFAKEDGTGLFGRTTPASDTELTWSMATTYFVRNGEDPANPNIKYQCSSVLIGLDPAEVALNQGGSITIFLYEWEDTDNDGISQPNERGVVDGGTGKRVGNYTHILDGTESDLIISLDNITDGADETDPIQLQANTMYVLAVGMGSSTTSTTKIQIMGNTLQAYEANNFITDSIAIERIGCMWHRTLSDAGSSTLSDLTLLPGFSPRIRMHVTPYTITSLNAPLDEANKVTVFPNPATDEVSLKLDLVENMEKAVIRIVDLNAHNVMERTYDNLSSQTLTFPVSDLPAGVYFIKIQSDKGYSIQKFTIIK